MTGPAMFAAIALVCPSVAVYAHGGGGGGPSQEQRHHMDRAGIPGGLHGEAHGRFGGNPAAYGHMARYGGPGAPISTANDLRYIQNHMASGWGFPPAADNSTQIPWNSGTKFFPDDPGGGRILAAPKTNTAPWELGVMRPLVQMDLALNPKDPYANRVAGIQDAFQGDYAKALPALRTAIEGGQQDATALSFAALAAFHRGDMKSAAEWSKESLSKDASGPWSKLADSVEHLTEDRVGQKSIPKPRPQTMPRGADLAPGAVGQALFPGAVAEGTLKGAKGMVKDAQAALAVRDYPEARRLASAVLAQDAMNTGALGVRAAAALRQGLWDDAAGDAEKGLALKPGSKAFLEAKAMAAGRRGDYAAARAAALELLALDPRNPLALRLLAFAEAGLRDRAAMEAALARAGGDPAAAALLARARALPDGSDLAALFSDEFLLGDGAADAPKGGTGPSSPLKTAGAVGVGILVGLGAAAAALAYERRRNRAPATPGLDLSEFRRTRGTPAPAADPAEVGPYRVLGRAGSGGMGVVYKAQDSRLGRVVALKRLRAEVSADGKERERFLKEARIVSVLDHPGIVRIYSVEETAEGPYLVFEFVEGATLSELLASRGRLASADARNLILQAAAAVGYAHAQGVVHRDLKPSNMMVDSSGRLRVMDFGVARAERDALARLTGLEASGSPPYISPEQAEGRTSPACDVFALGVCLYELVAGRPPFEGSSGAMHLAKREGRWRPAGSPFDAVIARALAPDPAARFASVRDFAAALSAVRA